MLDNSGRNCKIFFETSFVKINVVVQMREAEMGYSNLNQQKITPVMYISFAVAKRKSEKHSGLYGIHQVTLLFTSLKLASTILISCDIVLESYSKICTPMDFQASSSL